MDQEIRFWNFLAKIGQDMNKNPSIATALPPELETMINLEDYMKIITADFHKEESKAFRPVSSRSKSHKTKEAGMKRSIRTKSILPIKPVTKNKKQKKVHFKLLENETFIPRPVEDPPAKIDFPSKRKPQLVSVSLFYPSALPLMFILCFLLFLLFKRTKVSSFEG